MSFVALACATAREPGGPFAYALQALGCLLVPLGVGVTVWAARGVGQDTYHYRDLFTGCRTVRLEDGGAYALCNDPMYALGPLAGYGVAMIALSPLTLFAAGLNQALLFVFNRLVEQPRLRRANGIFLETQRRYELARSLLAAEPGHAEAHGLLGRIAVHRRRLDAALRHFGRAVALDPANAGLQRGLAMAHVSAGHMSEAIECLQQAIALDPDDPATHNNLGNCHRRRDELAAAAASYRRRHAATAKSARMSRTTSRPSARSRCD